MKRKLMAALLACALAACGLGAACAEDARPLTIVVVPKAIDNLIFLDAKAGAQAAGQALGINVEWTGPATSDAAAQAEVVQKLIDRGVDGILISCNDAQVLGPVIDRAVEAGIAVATFDADAPDSGRLFYIGSDNYALGLASAHQMLALLPQGGRVAVLEGNPDALNLQQRLQGFYDGIAGSGIECYPAVSGKDDFVTSVAVVEQFTAETEALDAWFLAGGWPLFAEPEALPNLTAFARAGGHVVAVDAAWPMLRHVEDGVVDVLLGQGYTEMGEVGVTLLHQALTSCCPYGGDTVLYAGMDTVMADNLDEIRAGKTPW